MTDKHTGHWSASEGRRMPVPRGVDPDEFRSRKAAGDLRDVAHPQRSIRTFMERVLLRKLAMGRKVP